MNHKEKLKEIYSKSKVIDDIKDIHADYVDKIEVLANKVWSHKGVFSVFVTLAIHKILHPKQDIRYHQSSMKDGFSGRTFDTKYITPTLKSLGLPSMAESGWLTRSLEQPKPYTLDYDAHIKNKEVKKAFLSLIDYIQNHPDKCDNVLKLLIYKVRKITEASKVEVIPLEDPDKLTVLKLIEALKKHFSYSYNTFGGSKLPVLSFYSIYGILIDELSRYKDCNLAPLGSHTASDRTSKTAGDIQILKGDKLLEAVEIKLDVQIDANRLRIAREKIILHNPKRYYILSDAGIKKDENKEIGDIITDVRKIHGCQIILNGVIPTLKYYLRLISDLEDFFNKYSQFVKEDLEIKRIHKDTWNKIIRDNLNA